MTSNCTNDCRYHQMYVASQRSMENLSATQASAIGRAQTLREGIRAALRKHYPSMYASVNNKTPQGMLSLPDTVLLSYLDGFLASPTPNVASRVAAAARDTAETVDVVAVLSRLGYPVTAQTPLGDALALIPPATSQRSHSPVGVHESDTDSPGHSPGQPPDVPDVAEPQEPGWFDLFDDDPPPADPADYSPGEDELYQRKPLDLGARAQENLEDMFADVPSADPLTLPATPAQPYALFDEPEPDREQQSAGGDADNVTETRTATDTHTAPARGTGNARPARTRMQPALIPSAKPAPKNTRKKVAAVSVADPANASGDHVALTDEYVTLFTDALKAPKPVFMSDLTGSGVTEEFVSAWIAQEATQPEPAVRVIGAKDHHYARGDLLVPHTKLFSTLGDSYHNSVWGRCVVGLRGPRLYEAGVIVSEYPRVKSLAFDARLVTFTADVNTRLTGIILTTVADIKPSSPIRSAMAKTIAGLMSKRVHTIYVVTSAPGKNAAGDIAESLHTASTDWNITITAPVVVTRTIDVGKSDPVMVAALG
jgi:hypothetical protein